MRLVRSLFSLKSQFHTTSSVNIKYKKLIAVSKRKKNQATRTKILKKKHESKSDPLFGVPTVFAGALFRQSDLYSFPPEEGGTNYVPQSWPSHTAWISSALEARKVIEACKLARALRLNPSVEELDMSIAPPDNKIGSLGKTGDIRAAFQEEVHKREALGRIMDLRNSNTKTLLVRNIELAIERFSRKKGDTGSPEVQAAVMTVRILFLGKHVQAHRHDNHSSRRLRILVHKRAAMLKYLRRESPSRYLECIKSLGLDNSVLREITLKL